MWSGINERGQKGQTFSYKMNESWGCNVQLIKLLACLKIAKRDLKDSHYMKKKVTMLKNVNYIYCGDHFAKYTNIELLCCTLEINTMLDGNNTTIRKKKGKLANITVTLTMLTMCWTHLRRQVPWLSASYREALRHGRAKGTKVSMRRDTRRQARQEEHHLLAPRVSPPPHSSANPQLRTLQS